MAAARRATRRCVQAGCVRWKRSTADNRRSRGLRHARPARQRAPRRGDARPPQPSPSGKPICSANDRSSSGSAGLVPSRSCTAATGGGALTSSSWDARRSIRCNSNGTGRRRRHPRADPLGILAGRRDPVEDSRRTCTSTRKRHSAVACRSRDEQPARRRAAARGADSTYLAAVPGMVRTWESSIGL